MLFCIEMEVLERAQLRMQTFRTDNPLFHDYLSETDF